MGQDRVLQTSHFPYRLILIPLHTLRFFALFRLQNTARCCVGISFPTFSFPAYRTPLVLFSSGFPSPSTFQQKQKCNCDWFRFTPLCDRLTTSHCFPTQLSGLGHPLSARLAPLARFCFEFRMIYFVVICSVEICQRN